MNLSRSLLVVVLSAAALARAADAVAGSTLVALFNATATPEREAHGAFLAALGRQRGSAEAVLALVDEGPWLESFGSEPSRSENRRAAWRELCEEARVSVVFADLANPDLSATDAALAAAIGDKNPT